MERQAHRSEADFTFGLFLCLLVDRTAAVGGPGLSYARQRGAGHAAIWKATKAGRIPLEPDGTIDPAKADAAWDRATDPAKRKAKPNTGATEKLRPVPETAIGSVRETLKEQGLPAGGNVPFVQARTAHEIAKAHLARLKLQERRGELIDRARATALVFRLAREERDAWANWPVRTSARMAAALGVDPFGGSGTTLIAAERTGRRARLVELDPRYVDVIVQRWQGQTGKAAVREDGTAFAELAKAVSDESRETV